MKILLIIILTFSILSCKSEAKITEKKERTIQVNNILISFISIGSGIDNTSIQKLEKLFNNFETNNKIVLKVSIQNWGKEGERNYCIDCSNLTIEQKNELKNSIESLTKDSKIIKVKTDTSC